MEDRKFSINKRRSWKAFPYFFNWQDLDLSLRSLGYFLEISEGLMVLIKV